MVTCRQHVRVCVCVCVHVRVRVCVCMCVCVWCVCVCDYLAVREKVHIASVFCPVQVFQALDAQGDTSNRTAQIALATILLK